MPRFRPISKSLLICYKYTQYILGSISKLKKKNSSEYISEMPVKQKQICSTDNSSTAFLYNGLKPNAFSQLGLKIHLETWPHELLTVNAFLISYKNRKCILLWLFTVVCNAFIFELMFKTIKGYGPNDKIGSYAHNFGLVPSSLPFRLMCSLKYHPSPSVTAYLLLPESCRTTHSDTAPFPKALRSCSGDLEDFHSRIIGHQADAGHPIEPWRNAEISV